MFGNIEVITMQAVTAVLLQLLLPTSCRVMLYDILSMGEDTGTSSRQPSLHRQRWRNEEIYGNDSPFSIKKHGPFKDDQMAYRVFQNILENHQVSNDVCVQSALKMCDIKPMARLLEPNEDACTLFKELDLCLQRELMHCSGDDVTLVQTSLKYLVEGYQVNGRCKDLVVGPPVEEKDQEEQVTDARPCNPHETWQCTRHMISNLRGKTKTCDVLRNFRHCIHRRTRSCSYEESKYLRDASKGLSILQRHSHLC